MCLSPLLAQSPVQSNEICTITGGQKRTSNNLARTNGGRYPHIFETHTVHVHGEHESKTPKHNINLKPPIADAPQTGTGVGTKNHLVYAVLVDQGQLYTDLTGKFPVRSRKQNSYVMVCYVYDCNYVKFILMKSRSASEWVKAYDHIHRELTVKGFRPKLQTLDNEASADLKNFFTVNDVEYKLVPPPCHRRNAAERAIQTFK
jgi:hypothetical protein